jgi:hypothetical protein
MFKQHEVPLEDCTVRSLAADVRTQDREKGLQYLVRKVS